MNIDAHRHFRDLDRVAYPWLTPEAGRIHRSFEEPDLWDDLDACGVDGTVLVQAANSFADIDSMFEVVDQWNRVRAVVGWVPLTEPDRAARALDRYQRDPRFAGVRHLIHDEPGRDWLLGDVRYLDVVCSLFGEPIRVFAVLSRTPGQCERGETHRISTGEPAAIRAEDNLGTPGLIEALYRCAATGEAQIPGVHMTAVGAGGRRVTLNDVAAAAGVDKAVVSRVVNRDPTLNIRPATRERVLAAIKELGYLPNVAARSLRTTRSGTLGLFIPDFANPVYTEIITGAESAALAAGYVLVTGSSTVAGSRTQAYLDLLGEGRVDGLLLAGGAVTAAEQATMAARGLPWLLVNRRGTKASRHVILADEHAARLAVEHLLELGHTRIAHIAGPARADTATRRRRGYRMALRKANIPEDPDLVVTGNYTPQGGAEAMHRLLRSGARPTAVFAANVASAIGVLNVLCKAGLTVPREMSVIAMHDMPLAEYLVPPLTTVRMPLRQLGIRAVELLLTRGSGEPISEVVGDPIELVLRESTAPPG